MGRSDRDPKPSPCTIYNPCTIYKRQTTNLYDELVSVGVLHQDECQARFLAKKSVPMEWTEGKLREFPQVNRTISMVAWEAACRNLRMGDAAYDIIVRPFPKAFFPFRKTSPVERSALRSIAQPLHYLQKTNDKASYLLVTEASHTASHLGSLKAAYDIIVRFFQRPSFFLERLSR